MWNMQGTVLALTVVIGLVLINDLTEPGIHMLATDKATRVTLKNQSGAEKVILP